MEASFSVRNFSSNSPRMTSEDVIRRHHELKTQRTRTDNDGYSRRIAKTERYQDSSQYRSRVKISNQSASEDLDEHIMDKAQHYREQNELLLASEENRSRLRRDGRSHRHQTNDDVPEDAPTSDKEKRILQKAGNKVVWPTQIEKSRDKAFLFGFDPSMFEALAKYMKSGAPFWSGRNTFNSVIDDYSEEMIKVGRLQMALYSKDFYTYKTIHQFDPKSAYDMKMGQTNVRAPQFFLFPNLGMMTSLSNKVQQGYLLTYDSLVFLSVQCLALNGLQFDFCPMLFHILSDIRMILFLDMYNTLLKSSLARDEYLRRAKVYQWTEDTWNKNVSKDIISQLQWDINTIIRDASNALSILDQLFQIHESSGILTTLYGMNREKVYDYYVDYTYTDGERSTASEMWFETKVKSKPVVTNVYKQRMNIALQYLSEDWEGKKFSKPMMADSIRIPLTFIQDPHINFGGSELLTPTDKGVMNRKARKGVKYGYIRRLCDYALQIYTLAPNTRSKFKSQLDQTDIGQIWQISTDNNNEKSNGIVGDWGDCFDD